MSAASDLDANLAALTRIGWRTADARTLPPDLPADRRVARITAQHRSGFNVDDGTTSFAVHAPAAMLRPSADLAERPAVGDFVVIAPGKPPGIEALLPRRSLLARAAAGERHAAQAIAANVDTVMVVCGLDGDYNPRRIERYLVLVRGSGAMPVVVLTKRDKVEAADAMRDEIQRLAAPTTPVLAINAKDRDAIAALHPFLGPGDTAVLVGSSGAGKSTLTNSLLGIEKQRTAAVRGSDSRVRHTTTHRALIRLPTGGCLIDTPGMRELKLTGDEALDTAAFADIEDLARGCRFSDCAHGNEPGCRVRAALASGELEAARWAHYEKLREELATARAGAEVQRRRKAEAKVMTRALGKRLGEKYGPR